MILDERLALFIDTLQWQLPDDLKELEAEALQAEVPIIRRSMQSLLTFLLELRRPGRVLEIGAAVGFSSMLISEYVPETTQITTIEKVPQRISAARSNYEKYGKTDRIVLLEGDAAQVLKQLKKEEKTFDFIFMDAAKGQYMNFLPDVLQLLDKEGILITDNVLQDGDVIQSRYAVTRRDRTIHTRMRDYLHFLTHTEGIRTVILPVGDGVTLSIKQ